MLILHSLLSELKDEFASSENSKERSAWFLYTLLAIIIPFTSSRTSNLLRVLHILFGFAEIGKKWYYTVMASPKIPWDVANDPRTGNNKIRACRFLENIARKEPHLFVHWQKGMVGAFS